MVINLEVILQKLLYPPNLIKTKIFYIYKIAKSVMANKEKNFIFTIFKVLLLSLKTLNNSQKFIIVNFILNFYKNCFLKK